VRVFTAIPFLRILPPFLAGIPAGIYLHISFSWWCFFFGVCCLLIFYSYVSESRFRRFIFFGGSDLFLFVTAAFLVYQTDLRTHSDFFAQDYRDDEIISVIVYPSDLPIRKEKWRKCELVVTHVVKGSGSAPAVGKLIGYFKYDIDSSFFVPGRLLRVTTRLVPAQKPLNPAEFDYANWLSNRQIFYTVFVSANQVSLVGASSEINPVWALGLKCRAWLLARLHASGLDQQAFAICSALLTGQDDDIDRDTMSAFAHSGTLHVLSVSGLHTGLVYLAIDFIFSLFAGKKRHRLLRLLVITCGLWAFALMTGFAAPVLRAVIMFNLVGMGNIYFRNHPGNQLNILFLSAFILLSWNPYFLFDLGFMLSYLAMIGLICFTGPLLSLWTPDNVIITTIWKSVCASFAATISTLPITLFFFKQFPIWFFICNLVVVPASSILLFLTVLLVIKIPLVALICNSLVNWLIVFIQWFNKPGVGFVDYLDFGTTDLLFCVLLIMLLSVALQSRSHRSIVWALVCLIAWQCFSLVDSFLSKKSNEVVVYHLKKHSGVTVKSGRDLSLSLNDSTAFDFHIRPKIISYNYPLIKSTSFNYVSLGGKGIVFIDGSGAQGPFPSGTSTIVLANNAECPSLASIPRLSMIVCDGSNNPRSVERADSLSRKFAVSFHSTASMGAAELVLK
jgi:competence protein ComEC